MREITIRNKKLKELLEKRVPLVQQGRDLQDELEAMKTEFKAREELFKAKVEEQGKVAKKINKIKDKIIPILQRETEGKLDEFEDTREAEISGDDIIVSIGNHLEEFKERFLAQRNKTK